MLLPALRARSHLFNLIYRHRANHSLVLRHAGRVLGGATFHIVLAPDGSTLVLEVLLLCVEQREGVCGKGHGTRLINAAKALLLEQASQQLSGPGGAPLPGAAVTRLPDFTAHIRHERDGWHGQLATVLRQISFEADPAAAAAATAADDETFGFGVALSGHTRLGDPGRRLMGQVSYGEGYAYYNQSLRGSDWL